MKTRVVQPETGEGGFDASPRTAAGRPARPRSPGRIAAGAVTAALGVAALAGGGALVAVHGTQPDNAGFYTAEGRDLATPTRALVSEDLDVVAGPDWLLDRLGDVRVTATGGARDSPVFVGIGPRADVAVYLDGVAHAVTDFEGGGSDPSSGRPGRAVPAPPGAQAFWVRSASGPGAQRVVWPVEAGDWTAVVMNADGSAGIRARTEVGLRTGIVLWLGLAGIIIGVGLLGAGTALGVSGRARRAGRAM